MPRSHCGDRCLCWRRDVGDPPCDANATDLFITIEEPVEHPTHPQIPTLNTVADLRANLAALDLVRDGHHIIPGTSFENWVLGTLHHHLLGQSVELLVWDADACIDRDLIFLAPFLAPGCKLVIDDYVAGEAKSVRVRAHLLPAAHRLRGPASRGAAVLHLRGTEGVLAGGDCVGKGVLTAPIICNDETFDIGACSDTIGRWREGVLFDLEHKYQVHDWTRMINHLKELYGDRYGEESFKPIAAQQELNNGERQG